MIKIEVEGAREVQRDAVKLDSALGNNGHTTAGQVFGIGRESAIEVVAASPQLRSRETGRGTSLINLDIAGIGEMSRLSPGDIIALTAVREPNFTDLNRTKFEKFAQGFGGIRTIATVIGNENHSLELFGYIRKPRQEDLQGGRTQGVWGEYLIDSQGTVRTEEQDAIELLARLFHPRKGNEATNVMSRVFASTTGDPTELDNSIAAEGCNSHKNPRLTIPRSFLTAHFIPRNIHIRPDAIYLGGRPSKNQWVAEVKIDQTGHVVPLHRTSGFLEADESPLFVGGIDAAAQRIAETNPQGFGGGTQKGAVVDALLKTASGMHEYADARVRDVVQVFKSNLGVR